MKDLLLAAIDQLITDNINVNDIDKVENSIWKYKVCTNDNYQVLTEIQDINYNNYLFGNNRISSNKANYISDYSNTVVMILNHKGDINTEYNYTDYGLRDKDLGANHSHIEIIRNIKLR